MSVIVTLSRPFLTNIPYRKPPSHFFRNPQIHLLKSHSFQPLLASRRIPNFPQGTDDLVDGPRSWSRSMTPEFDDDQEVDEDEEEEEDRSLDLLVRFVQNVFRKISKRARKAVRAVLPVSIPSNLVGFSVNGVLILAFLWVLKAFLEVVCTLGSVVFVSILLIRGIWTGVTYMQESREQRINEPVDDQRAWTGAQPAT
ncbi:protein SHORT HYPOCOTYL IN WHITE LIGHT 1 [Durio zibethinus]|uniref:Protein SHORT HYPOCOTYL IN WHITE LIGHT 1 n=1 Tax=Durio zibethinus TaxID=66656 RepID=A0A6P6AF93_DURZI|nr:protein SHORT HYPOCOTYL IN WHITE LIGHT 1 [Durio zibethinus]